MRQWAVIWVFLTVSMAAARGQSVPHFASPAAARAFGEAQERAGHRQAAGLAYLQEADGYRRRGDGQAAEAETRRARRLMTDVAAGVSAPVVSGGHLGKLEPVAGCYLGALDETAGGHLGNVDDLERRVGRSLSVAFNYARYGDPFPLAWARHQAREGRLVQIAWEPEGGLGQVRDDAYLHDWARDASECGTGVFLRFAGEMNGGWTAWGRDPAAYRRAFWLVHSAMAQEAGNVAMVWAPNAVPTSNWGAYYPGDDAVDWVGLSLYLVRFYDDDLRRPAWRDAPEAFLDAFYHKYAARKPVCLAECGVSRRSRVEGADADPFAAARIGELFDALRVRYPRLKMACWFDRDNLTGASAGRRLNDYSLPPGSLALASFRAAVADPYFLADRDSRAPLSYRRVGDRLPAGYVGPVLFSVTTYALDSVLSVSQAGRTARVVRPFRWFAGGGHGLVTVRVVDAQGRVAWQKTLSAP